ncbi:haloacid dehalogenase-like hydrolase [Botrytis cinerea]
MAPITTLLFDCDNTLVLSESLAFEACADLANEILEARGISDRLKSKYNYEMSAAELEGYVSKEEDKVIAKLKAALKPCEGVDEELVRLEKEGGYLMAVVSSSALRRLKASVEKTDQAKYFGDRIYSAATSLEKPTSKPDPAVYLHAMQKLGVEPQECVAIEDSKSGATAAVRAGILTVGYVGSYEVGEQKEMEEVLRKAGCKVLMREWKEFKGILEKIQQGGLEN